MTGRKSRAVSYWTAMPVLAVKPSITARKFARSLPPHSDRTVRLPASGGGAVASTGAAAARGKQHAHDDQGDDPDGSRLAHRKSSSSERYRTGRLGPRGPRDRAYPCGSDAGGREQTSPAGPA